MLQRDSFGKGQTRGPIYSSPISHMVVLFSTVFNFLHASKFYALKTHLPSNNTYHHDSASSDSDDPACDHVYSQLVPFYEEDDTASAFFKLKPAHRKKWSSWTFTRWEIRIWKKPRVGGRVHNEGNLFQDIRFERFRFQINIHRPKLLQCVCKVCSNCNTNDTR